MDTQDIFTARLVGEVIGVERLNSLIMTLPHEFFKQDFHVRARGWRAALKAANQGERDIEKLANEVRHNLSS